MLDAIRDGLTRLGLSEDLAEPTVRFAAILGVVVLAWLANLVTKKVIIRLVHRVVQRTRTDWDDALERRKVFTRLSHLAPALVIWELGPQVLGVGSDPAVMARQGAEIYMLLVALFAVNAFLDAGSDIFQRFTLAMRLPIKVYIQVAKILLAVAAGVFTFSIVLDKSPWVFLSGLGALTAVILLIFKDSILGLVAGVQLSANDMVRAGDWIQMPKYGADGDVIEVTLTTVKVRNWDKTISTIPTYALISDSFKNWRGMTESGGRRIKRSIWIDVNSIKFCTPEMIDRFSGIRFLEEYISTKQKELAEFNAEHGIDDHCLVNGRRMTNIGTFRQYLIQYLRHHPKIHQEMTFLVRHLQPTEKGLPVEVYVFSNDQAWANYEAIQADIFDHIFAALPEFDLRPFQAPSGADIAASLTALSRGSRPTNE